MRADEYANLNLVIFVSSQKRRKRVARSYASRQRPWIESRLAVDAIQTIVVEKKPKETVTKGPFLFRDAVLVDKTNVPEYLK